MSSSNPPCPCGSGKRYKKCCRAKSNQSRPKPASARAQPSPPGRALPHPGHERIQAAFADLGDDEELASVSSTIFGHESEDPASESVCMIQKVDEECRAELQRDFDKDFPLGSWALSSGSHSTGLKVLGPFDNMEEAINEARDKYNTVRWSSGWGSF